MSGRCVTRGFESPSCVWCSGICIMEKCFAQAQWQPLCCRTDSNREGEKCERGGRALARQTHRQTGALHSWLNVRADMHHCYITRQYMQWFIVWRRVVYGVGGWLYILYFAWTHHMSVQCVCCASPRRRLASGTRIQISDIFLRYESQNNSGYVKTPGVK